MRKELWIFLFFIGYLALGWPFLEIFGSNQPLYLFTAWLCLIAAIYIAVQHMAKKRDN